MDFSDFISGVFALPASAISGQKLPKTFFYNNFDLLASEKKLIENPEIIEAVEILATVNQRNANIPAVHTEDETFDEVVFLKVKMSPLEFDKQKNKIAEILHKYIPNHLLVVVYTDEKMMLSIAEKRVNQNDLNRRIVVMQYDSEKIHWKYPTCAQNDFLQNLSFSKANTFNIQEYYNHFVQCFSGLEVSRSTGQFTMRSFERSREDVQTLNKITELEEEITTFQNKAKKETQMNEILNWNTKIQQHRNAIAKLRSLLTSY